uniref:p61 n=1 Tax=Plum bark necrosis stem pitting-associated virus TaxID=675077 RepID=A0A075X107_9CLOS|nr:P61 [Plum bark necrosis stem pitting-associated virus]
MALSSTSTYVEVDKSDRGLVELIRRFFCRSDGSEEIDRVYDLVKGNIRMYSVATLYGSLRVATWFENRGALYAWSDVNGYARALLAVYINTYGTSQNSYYEMSTSMKDLLLVEQRYFDQSLGWVDKKVTQSQEFSDTVDRSVVKTSLQRLNKDSTFYSYVAFALSNYLGRICTEGELFGQVTLPVYSRHVRTDLVFDGLALNAKEIALVRLSVKCMTQERHVVLGVKFKRLACQVASLQNIIMTSDTSLSFSYVPAVKLLIVEALESTEISTNTFESRVRWLEVPAAVAVKSLRKYFLSVKAVTPKSLFRTISRLTGESFEGSVSLLTHNLPDVTKCYLVYSVGSPLGADLNFELTSRLISTLMVDNPELVMSFQEWIILLIQRFCYRNTNTVRYVDIPKFSEVEYDDSLYLVDFIGADKIFCEYSGRIPNIQRLRAGGYATEAYTLLKRVGAMLPKWPDVMNLPSYRNFDFVVYVNPLIVSEEERVLLAELLNRFRTVETKIGGFTLGSRSKDPSDYMFEDLVGSENMAMVKELNGASNQLLRRG